LATSTYRVMVVEYNGGAGYQAYATGTGSNNPNNITTATPTITVPGGTTTVPGTTTGTASASANFSISGSNLTSGNITVTAPSNFQVSPDNSTWNSSYTIAETGTLSAAVYVRLSASDGVNTYNGNVTISGGGATSKTQAVSGTVTNPPTITVPGGTITVAGTAAGTASASTSFSISGSYLTTGNITVTAPSGFDVSPDNSTWGSTYNIAETGTLASTTVYVRLSASDGAGTPGGNVTISGGGATSQNQAVSGTVIGAPTTQASYAGTDNIAGSSSYSFGWTNGNGTSRAVFIEAGSSGTPGPVNDATYTASTAFGTAGTEIGSSGWYCVYNGTGTSVIVTGLSQGTAYQLMVVEYNGTTGNEAYDTSTAIGNPDSFTTPVPTLAPQGGTTTTVPSTTAGTASAETSFDLDGSNLITGNITVTAPAGFDVSPDNSTWGSTYNIAETGQFKRLVYVRLSASDVANTYNGNVTFSGGGAATASHAVTGTVTNPSTTISSLSAVSSTLTNAASVQYTATFAASVSNLSASNFSLTTSGVSGAAVASVSGSGTNWTVTVSTGSGDGTLQLSMNNATGVSPSVSNAPFSGDTYTIDKTPPTALSLSATDPTLSNQTELDYQITFSEPVTGVVPGDFTAVTTGGVTAGAISETPISSTVYNVSIVNVSGNGTLEINLNSSGTGIQDLAGNAITGGINGDTYTVDQTPPAVTAITATTPSNATPTNATSLTYTITFSEPVTGVNAGSFTLTQTGTASGSLTNVTGSGTTYSMIIAGVSGDGTLRLDLNSSGTGIQDAAGNTPSGGFTGGDVYTIEHTPPAASPLYFSSNNVNYAVAVLGNTVTLVFGANEAIQTPVVTIGGHSVTAISTGGNNYTASYTLQSTDPYGIIHFTLSMTDLAGNTSTYNDVAAGDYITYENTALMVNYLALDHGTLSPAFNQGTTSYVDSLGNSYTQVNVGAVLNDRSASITVNGTPVASGSKSGEIPLSTGNNTITVVVTSHDGSTSLTYTIIVNRAAAPPATLSYLTLNHGTLSPAFNPATTSYTDSLAHSFAQVDVSALLNNAGDSMTVNGTALASGGTSGQVPLSVGNNTINVVVTSQDGFTSLTYTVVVNRAAAPPATLVYLALNHGALSPAFDPATTSYNVSLDNTYTQVEASAILNNAGDSMTVNGAALASGGTSGEIPLSVGDNPINVVVTSQDSLTVITYTIIVNRAGGVGIYAVKNLFPAAGTTELADDGVVVHPAVSPNGDGIDDVLKIDGLSAYPDNKLTIMNQGGTTIYEANGYDNSSRVFDGHSSKTGSMQQPGTYFYLLQYSAAGKTKTKTGFIILKY
jgi:hypothetical protein